MVIFLMVLAFVPTLMAIHYENNCETLPSKIHITKVNVWYQGNLTKISRSCNLIKHKNCKLWHIQPHPGGVRSHQGAGEDLWRGCWACQVWGELCFKHSTICDGEVLYHKLNSQYSNEFLRHCRMCDRSFHHNNRNHHDCQVWFSKRLQMLPWKRLQREDVDPT